MIKSTKIDPLTNVVLKSLECFFTVAFVPRPRQTDKAKAISRSTARRATTPLGGWSR